jgi:YgiT-type zinc finger domain-containing protein
MANSKTTKTHKVISNPYGDCWYCGGKVVEKFQTIDYRYKGKLYLLEKIPTGVCMQCGEKFFKAEISKRMEKTIQSMAHPKRKVAIPVLAI